MSPRRISIINEKLLFGIGEIPSPLPTSFLFNQEAPINVEIGCGTGSHLAHLASVNPREFFVGIEKELKYARLTAWRLQKNQCLNASVLNVEGQFALKNLFMPRSIQHCYIFFPDPWFKKRHVKRRVITPEFLYDLSRSLKPEGWIQIKTDIDVYAVEISRAFQQIKAFQVISDPVLNITTEDRGTFETNYEKKARNAGRPVFFFQYTL